MSESASRRVQVRAPAKINLMLAVGPQAEDGYHPLATVFQAISLFEEVSAEPDDELRITVSGLGRAAVPTDESNLAIRAARALAMRTGVRAGVHLHIHKGIPVAGGLAGGSADAAAALVACDALWRTGLSRSELVRVAATIGSDVPFSLTGHTAVGTHHGEMLTTALTRGQYHWALALRHRGLSTPQVYRVFDELVDDLQPADPVLDESLMQALRAGDVHALGSRLNNDLQPAALAMLPELARTLEVAKEAGALGSIVSGSGPTVIALAEDREHADHLAAAWQRAGVADDVVTAAGPVPGARQVEALDGTGGAGGA